MEKIPKRKIDATVALKLYGHKKSAGKRTNVRTGFAGGTMAFFAAAMIKKIDSAEKITELNIIRKKKIRLRFLIVMARGYSV
jgi:hypothetical protein